MGTLLELVAVAGEFLSFITPFTFVVGLINAIKKPEKESIPYTIVTIVSAYLIIIPLIMKN